MTKVTSKTEIMVKAVLHGFVIPMMLNISSWYLFEINYQDMPINLFIGLGYILVSFAIYNEYKFSAAEAFYSVSIFTVMLFVFSLGAWADI